MTNINKYLSLCNLALLIFVLFSKSVVAQESNATDASKTPDENIDEVLVVGEQPGPSLWRVYKDDHVMWVMGTLSPLSKDMHWHSKQVDAAVANPRSFCVNRE